MTLKEAQALLRAWGKFWRSKEYGTGYGSTSITYQMMQTGLLGQACKSTKHLFIQLSESQTPPLWIQDIDRAMEGLTVNEKAIIHRFYIKKSYKIDAKSSVLIQAEIKLASRL
jgi:hypothetical protein